MHNWEHYGRLPAYFLAATLVASCGDGGGDGILGNITGVSDAQVTLTAASGDKLSAQGEMPVTVWLLDQANKPLANKQISLTASSKNVKLSSTQVTTDSNGLVSFVIQGNVNGTLTNNNNSGQVTATYKDTEGDIKTAAISYTIVETSELEPSYAFDSSCFVLETNPCASFVVLKTVGSGSQATAEFTLVDGAKKPLVGKRVNFSLLKPTGSGGLLADSAITDGSGKVRVNVQADRKSTL